MKRWWTASSPRRITANAGRSHWLDVARFSESQGFEYDRIRDNAWRYRDYVVQSFNDDKSYPQFVKEQIAGDVLEPVTPGGIVATGFLTAGPWDEAGNGSASTLLRRASARRNWRKCSARSAKRSWD